MKLLEEKLGNENWGGPPPQDFTPAEELALSSYQGHPMMEGVEGGISSDPGGCSSEAQAYVCFK